MFEYDPDKSAANLAKHGIDFDQAQALWMDNDLLTIAARPGRKGEVRALVIGYILEKLWSAVVTLRGDAIRIISVRRSRNDEKELYDDQNN
jgi:uncharacterized protein